MRSAGSTSTLITVPEQTSENRARPRYSLWIIGGLVGVDGGVGRSGARVLHCHLRRRRSQRVASIDPHRSRRRDHGAAVGRRRLHVDVRRAAPRRRSVQRPGWGTTSVHHWGRRLRRRVSGLWSGPRSRSTGRCKIRSGFVGGRVGAGVDGLDQPGLPEPVAASTGNRDVGHGRSGRLVVCTCPWRTAHRRVVAADLPHQYPHRDPRHRARHASRTVSPPRRRVRPIRIRRRVPRHGWAHVRRDRSRRRRLHLTVRAGRVRARGVVVRDLPRLATTCSESDRAAGVVRPSQHVNRWSSSGSRSLSATTACRS